MRVLGIDPGTRKLGWGVVDQQGNRMQHVAHGVLALGDGPLAQRLVAIDAELSSIIAEHRPDEAAVEALFFAKNAQSASKLGHARGVVLLALCRAGLTIGEYPPTQVKRAVVGKGRADKRQVAMLVRGMLGLADVPPSDAADAMAVAITHLSVAPFLDASAPKPSARRGGPGGRRRR